MNITNCVFDASINAPILNPTTGVLRTEATHRFIARAVLGVEVNDFEQKSAGNRFLGGPFICLDQNKDGACDR